MFKSEKALHFFLGANTPQGFVSRFDQLADPESGWREFVVKGGPGTGKSTLMRKVAELAASDCEAIELIHCSSDVDSLDGVIVHDIKTAIADGTPPHAIEPQYPGAFEQLIDLSGCWDTHTLYESRLEIMPLASKISRCHEHCRRFLCAANSLLMDTYRIALEATSTTKTARAARRIAQAEFHGGKEVSGKESVRLLSAVTNRGIVQFEETAQLLCERIYRIDDPYGAASRLLLQVLRSEALAHGLDIISCYCPLAPFEKLEHLFIPSLKLGFMTANDYHGAPANPYKIIRARRFTDPELLKKSRKRIAFNKKAAGQMLEQSVRLLGEAKTLHDKLETYYIAAMNFDLVDAVTKQTLDKYDLLLKEKIKQ